MEYLFIFAFVLYLAPWILAESIEHRSATAILFLNLGLGWTGIGWLAAAGWVYRDWPRPAVRPQLVVVRAGSLPSPPRWRSALVPAAASLALIAAVATLAATHPAEVAPEWEIAQVDLADAPVHLGAGTEWPRIGTLDPRCRVRILEREGGWMRVWRLGPCADGMDRRAGWMRMEALRPTAATER